MAVRKTFKQENVYEIFLFIPGEFFLVSVTWELAEKILKEN